MGQMIRKLITAIASIGISTSAAAQVAPETIAVCQASPTAECLADIGYESALASEDFTDLSSVALAAMGRAEDAWAIIVHSEMAQGESRQHAEQFADSKVIDYRIIERLEAGDDLRTAISRYGANEEQIKSVLARLIGSRQTGPRFGRHPTDDPDRRVLLKKLALEAQDGLLPPLKAAEMLFILGEIEAGREIMLNVRDDDIPHELLSENAVRLIGVERILRVYSERGDIPKYYYVPVFQIGAPRELIGDLLKNLLTLAEKIADAEERFTALRSLVYRASKHDFNTFSQDLVERMLQDFEKNAVDYSQTNIPLLLVDVLVKTDTKPELIRSILVSEEWRIDAFPWVHGRNSLRRQFGRAYLKIGDSEAAFRILSQPDSDGRDWFRAILVANTADLRERLLDVAVVNTSESEMNVVLAELAAWLSGKTRTVEERAWAHETVRDLVEREAKIDGSAKLGTFYDHILEVAVRTGDSDLILRALRQSATRSLTSKDPNAVLKAAWQFYMLDS